jgi:hypothetical protein
MSRRRLWIVVAVVIAIAVAVVALNSKKEPVQDYTTTVSVESGEVEVQSPEGTARLKAGEKSVVRGSERPVKVKVEVNIEEEEEEPEVEEGGFIGGIIVAKSGSPIEGVAFAAKWHTKPDLTHAFEVDGKVRKAKSDASGLFRLSGLEEKGSYDLLIKADGFAETIFKSVKVGTTDNKIILPPEAIISGNVYVDKTSEPLEGAKVRLEDMDIDKRFSEREELSSSCCGNVL